MGLKRPQFAPLLVCSLTFKVDSGYYFSLLRIKYHASEAREKAKIMKIDPNTLKYQEEHMNSIIMS